MNQQHFSNHESWEIHELLTFKTICATKAHAMSAIAQDQELKDLLDQDYTAAIKNITDLKDLLQLNHTYMSN